MGNYKAAISIHKGALQLAERSEFTELIPQIIIYVGQDHADGGEFREALQHFENAKDLFKKAGNQSQVANCLLMISWVHDGRGNFPESSKANIEALKIYESLNEHYGISVASSMLHYRTQKKHWQQEIKYLIESLLEMLIVKWQKFIL